MTGYWDALGKAVGGLASVIRHVGLVNALFAILTLLLLGAVLRCVERVTRLVDWFEKRWRRLPTWGRQVTAAAGLVAIFPMVRAALFHWQVFAALAVFVAAAFSAGGFYFGQRYGVFGSPWAAWMTHLRSKADARKLTRVPEKATGKKNGRATNVRRTGDRITAEYEPPDGTSPAEYADEINNGKLHPTTAREMGWDEVKGGMSATVLPNGKVAVRIAREVDSSTDPLIEAGWWQP